jgi:hypothetical protein
MLGAVLGPTLPKAIAVFNLPDRAKPLWAAPRQFHYCASTAPMLGGRVVETG